MIRTAACAWAFVAGGHPGPPARAEEYALNPLFRAAVSVDTRALLVPEWAAAGATVVRPLEKSRGS